jgi:hypothetical protein
MRHIYGECQESSHVLTYTFVIFQGNATCCCISTLKETVQFSVLSLFIHFSAKANLNFLKAIFKLILFYFNHKNKFQ